MPLQSVPLRDTNAQFIGSIHHCLESSSLRDQLSNPRDLLSHPSAERLSHGKDYVIRLQLPDYIKPITIKVFKRQSRLKDWYDKTHKSKAQRSFEAAEFLMQRGISTPLPLAWLDRWEGNRLIESYYLCEFEPAICFRDALSHIYYEERDNEPLMQLLLAVAPGIRAMHDAGFQHGDMGNQNILLPKDQQGQWLAPQFIDLNRARYGASPLTDAERAFDISRIVLPGQYLKIFKHIYFNHGDIPAAFNKLETTYRRRFERHTRSRAWRHPIRHFTRKPPTKPVYPTLNNIWLWDEKSAQPMTVMESREKKRFYRFRDGLATFWNTLRRLPAIYSHYRALNAESYQHPIDMRNRIGIALHPHPNYVETEWARLKELGFPPVLIRFAHHETQAQWNFTLDLIDRLHVQGARIMVGILQDRRAVLEPMSWTNFLEHVIPPIANKVDAIEITHACNRVKWGIWSSNEYAQLLMPALALRKRYPQIKLTGPAVIDFEYISVIATLSALPHGECLDALSHLLYVDRRGAPENKQGKFSTLEKTALLKAVARATQKSTDKIIVSEVNWPVKHTGIYSPIGCPYVTPKWRREEPGETDDDYANYLVRYYLICLCSGHVEQVFWWRLSANGYGLVDDLNGFKPRPAFFALKTLLAHVEHSQFVKRWRSNPEDYILEFCRNDGSHFVVAWTSSLQIKPLPDTLQNRSTLDRSGEPELSPQLSQRPIYIQL